MIWISVLLPGMAGALIQFANREWIHVRIPSPDFWQEILPWGPIMFIALATSGFVGYLDASKSGRADLTSLSLILAFRFLIGQMIVAPLVYFIAWIVIYF